MRLFRIFITLLSILAVITASGCCKVSGKKTSTVPLKEAPAKKAEKIHMEVLTVDTHVDTPYQLLKPGFDISKSHNSRKGEGRVDFPRMKQGGLDAIFFAVFVGQGPCTPEAYQKVKDRAMSLFEAIHKALKKHSEIAELALTSEDPYRIEKSGRRAIFIGIENGYARTSQIFLSTGEQARSIKL